MKIIREIKNKNINDSSGWLDAHRMCHSKTTEAINILKKNKIFDALNSKFKNNYFETYLFKNIYHDYLEYFKKKYMFPQYTNIKFIPKTDISLFCEVNGLNLSEIYKKNFFTIIKIIFKKALLKILKIFSKFNNEFVLFSYGKSIKFYSEDNILINFTEGFDNFKRNDIYWLNEDLKKRSIIFFDSKSHFFTFFQNKNEFFNSNKKLNLTCIKIFGKKILNIHKNIKEKYFYNFINCSKNTADIFLKDEYNNFINLINFYYKIYKKFNIKIHYCPDISSLNTIAATVALELLKGYTFTSIRSYISYNTGIPVNTFYIQNLLFVWGEDQVSRLNDNGVLNPVKLIVGYPYMNNNIKILKNRKKNELDYYFRNINIKKKIIVAINADINDQFNHGVSKSLICKFFDKLIDILKIDPEIVFILKFKKQIRLYDHKLFKYFKKNIFIVNDPFGELTLSYIEDVYCVLAIDSWISTVAMECLAYKKPVLSYSNLSILKHEKGFYKKYEDTLFFSDFNKFQKAIEDHLLKNKNFTKIEYDCIDPYSDYKSSERIASILSKLIIHSKNSSFSLEDLNINNIS